MAGKLVYIEPYPSCIDLYCKLNIRYSSATSEFSREDTRKNTISSFSAGFFADRDNLHQSPPTETFGSNRLSEDDNLKCLQNMRQLLTDIAPILLDNNSSTSWFQLCVRLGHDVNTICDFLLNFYFQNGCRMPQLQNKKMIKLLIDYEFESFIKDDSQESIHNLHNDLLSAIAIIASSKQSLEAQHCPPDPECRDASQNVEASAPLNIENCSLIVKTLCRICEEKGSDVVGLPCGHICRCSTCWLQESERDDSSCPYCFHTVETSFRVFFS